MSQFFEDVPSGVINGTNTQFTIHYNPTTIFTTPSLEVYLNGVLQQGGTDYTLSIMTLAFTNPPLVGDFISTWVFQT